MISDGERLMSGSEAAALGAWLCKPEVVSLNFEASRSLLTRSLKELFKKRVVEAESPRSAMLIAVGAQSAGARTFSVSGSNDLLACSDLLHVVSGLRLPLVIGVVNNSVGAPFNYWNDHSDSISARESGWIQLHCENVQEVLDTILQAYRVAESVFLPVMVCFDAFSVSHLFEKARIPARSEADGFVKTYSQKHHFLDVNNPISIGSVAPPNYLIGFRKTQEEAMFSAVEALKKVNEEFSKTFNRAYGNGLVEEYKTEKADTIIVCMGSVAGIVKSVADKTKGVGVLRIKSLRPFPASDVIRVLSQAKRVGVIDRSAPLGGVGALFSEVKSVSPVKQVNGFVLGIGGKPVSTENVEFVIRNAGLNKNFWGEP